MAIPKIIHYCWFGHTEIPEEFKAYMDSWEKMCPDYEIKRWDESNYDITKNSYMKDAYDQKKWGFVPDYARLDIIYNEGGIYLDTDIEIVKSFDELLKNSAFCGIEAGNECVALGLGFGAEKGNEIIKLMRDEYDKISFINEDGSLNLLPSPQINTEPLYQMGYKHSDDIQTLHYKDSSITVYPDRFFCPKDFGTGDLKTDKDTYSIHHYAATWYTKKQKIRHEKNKIKREKYIARYGVEKTEQIFARRNSMLRVLYYLRHPVLAVKKIKEKLS